MKGRPFVLVLAATFVAAPAVGGPSYPIETHVACADAVVEAHLSFTKPIPGGWKPERGFPASVAALAERTATIVAVGGDAVPANRIVWDNAQNEMSASRWWEAYKAGRTRMLVFLRASSDGKWRSLILGVTGFENDLRPGYEETVARTRSLWSTRRPDRGVEGCSAKELALVGTVTKISRGATTPPSDRNWGVTISVERVSSGRYSEPTFTFSIHSPSRAGIAVGHRYTIEATWNGERYVVDDTRPIKEEKERRREAR